MSWLWHPDKGCTLLLCILSAIGIREDTDIDSFELASYTDDTVFLDIASPRSPRNRALVQGRERIKSVQYDTGPVEEEEDTALNALRSDGRAIDSPPWLLAFHRAVGHILHLSAACGLSCEV